MTTFVLVSNNTTTQNLPFAGPTQIVQAIRNYGKSRSRKSAGVEPWPGAMEN